MLTRKQAYIKLLVTWILCAVLLVIGVGAPLTALAEETEENTFTVLTYNIAGLPSILSSADPEKNTKRIGELINQFDLVAVQEDFAYHDELLEKSNFPYVTDHPGNIPFGSGLNVLSKFPIKDAHNMKWRMLHGSLTCPPFGYHGADALTPKGFSYQRMEIEPGAIVDVYNLHADAGGDEKSREARHDNFVQLAAYINTFSKGNAIILLGDTNAFYTRECDQLYVNLTQACGLTDPWIEYVREGDVPDFRPYDDTLEDLNQNLSGPNYETVDKILYRSSDVIRFEYRDYKIQDDLFLDDEGERLSDHYATSLTLKYTLSDEVKLSESYGGSGGDPFNFLPYLNEDRVTRVAIRSADRLDAISMVFGDNMMIDAGGQGGDYSQLELAEDEYITQLTVHRGKKWHWDSHRVYYAELATNHGNVLSGGTMTDERVTYTAPTGWYIAGFYGRSYSEIDQLGVIMIPLN